MKKLVMFLLGVVMLGAIVYPGVAFAEVANDESVADQEITLDDVDFPVDGDLGHVIQPRGRGECLSDERLGRVPKGYCSGIRVKVTKDQAKCLIGVFGTAFLTSTGPGWIFLGSQAAAIAAGCW